MYFKESRAVSTDREDRHTISIESHDLKGKDDVYTPINQKKGTDYCQGVFPKDTTEESYPFLINFSNESRLSTK